MELNKSPFIPIMGEIHYARIPNEQWEEQTVVFGGMNLAMALTATLMKDDVDTELLKDSLISEAKNAIKEFVLDSGADDEEDEI